MVKEENTEVMRMRERPGERVGYLGYGSEDDGPALELIQSGAPGEHGRMALTATPLS